MLTSGTTGGPRVVALPADALPDVLDGYAQRLGLTGEDSFAFTVPPAHDPVFRDLLLPLRLGAIVHVPGADGQDPRSLVPWLDEVGATVLHLTPAQGVLLTAAHPDREIGSLRRVVFHGDTLHYGTVARMRRLAPYAQIYNLYGTDRDPAGERATAGGARRGAARRRVGPDRGVGAAPRRVGARAGRSRPCRGSRRAGGYRHRADAGPPGWRRRKPVQPCPRGWRRTVSYGRASSNPTSSSVPTTISSLRGWRR
jgi:hypothetical protein